MKIILASKSGVRKKILDKYKVENEVIVSNVDEDEIKNIKMPTKRGRPSLDWNSFYLELTDRIKSDDLPDKQESFIAEMQDWCIKNWNQQVGRSTLLQKISPFYKKYVTK